MSTSSGQNKIREFLGKLSNIPEDQWNALQGRVEKVAIKKGQYFLRAGEVPNQIGFITNGLLRKFYLKDDGKEYIKDFSTEGSLVTAYSSLLLEETSIMNIQAVEDSQLLVVPYRFWSTLYDKHKCWQEIGRKIAELIFIQREQRERELLIYSATERYEIFVSKYPELIERLPQYDIASYLGISPVSLSRIVSKINAK